MKRIQMIVFYPTLAFSQIVQGQVEDQVTPLRDATTAFISTTHFGIDQVILAIAIIILLGMLFRLLFLHMPKIEQTAYLGRIFQESLVDLEYKRLAAKHTEQRDQGEYEREVVGDDKWLEAQQKEQNLDHEKLAELAARSSFGTSSFGGISGGFGDPWEEERQEAKEERTKRREAEMRERKIEGRFNDSVTTEARKRYRDDLDKVREQAKTSAKETVGNLDFATLRGQGPAFILQFTAIVVIISTAMILGVLGVLGGDHIGTLLAAIAGYVLGQVTQRGGSQAVTPSPATQPTPDQAAPKNDSPT
ncbi:exported protein of unknown function [uncultured Woeseiaceae bacterium]|uniref:Uncharacterized protein n=1 Tax=uncultured Woeseiaceae bacterium TaxID=1983305 RepID=A0A7D9D128_9GAMM|nr:exported protein of unknown function [uncultured Woeseiaceae bacterium]